MMVDFLNRIMTHSLGLDTRASSPTKVLSPTPGGALSLPEYHIPDQPLRPPVDGQQSIRDLYYYSYAYACANQIANSISALPFRAGNPLNMDFQLNAPLARLLGPAPGSPNNFMSAASLWRFSIIQRLLLGKFTWLIGRDSLNRVDGIYPLMAQFIKPVPAADRSTQVWKRFEYGVRGTPQYFEYTPDEVFYSWRPSQLDWHQPESVLQSAAVHIKIAYLIDRYDYAHLRNGGVPAGLLITPPFATKSEKDTWQANFTATFRGADQAGKVMFAEREVIGGDGTESPDSISWVPLAITPKDAQEAATRDAKIRDITMAFHVPLSVLGDSTLSKFQNAWQDRRNYWGEGCKPLIRELQDDVNADSGIAPLLGTESGFFDTSEVPELAKEPVLPVGNDAVTMEQAGAFSWSEWRSERGLPPLPQVNGPLKPETIKADYASVGDVKPPSGAPGVGSIRNFGVHEVPIRSSVMEMTGIEIHSRWLAQDDACDECQALDGKIDVVTSNPEYPDSAHPNCRCTQELFIQQVRSKPIDLRQIASTRRQLAIESQQHTQPTHHSDSPRTHSVLGDREDILAGRRGRQARRDLLALEGN